MKIALIAYLHGNGGAERQITMLANALTKRHEVYMIITGANNQKYAISNQVHIVDVTDVEGKSLSVLRRYWAQRKALIEINPEVSVHYNFQSAYFAVAMPKKYSGKIIYSERGDPYDDEYTGLLGLIRKYSIKKIDGFVFQTEGARDYFDEEIRKRSTVIHNPITIPSEYQGGLGKREKRIVNIGRLHPQKNQKLLVEAFSLIAEKYPDYTLEIFGDGILQGVLEEQIQNCGLKGRVLIKNPRKDIFGAIKDASLFVITSDYEGMPNALMEAMALGLPCISTDCRPGGARALIEDGINGFVVPRGDAKSLAEKMSYLLSNNDISQTIGLKAMKILDDHTPEEIFKKWEFFIEKITK